LNEIDTELGHNWPLKLVILSKKTAEMTKNAKNQELALAVTSSNAYQIQ
jgi:hypothetical protein